MNNYIKNKKILIVGIVSLSLVILFITMITLIKTKEKTSDYNLTEENKDKHAPEDDTITSYTFPVSSTEPVDKISEDFEYAEYIKGIYDKYPWYDKLPIDKEGYFLDWVLQENSFRITIKIKENSPKEQKDNLINQALEDIQNITGDSYKNYPYYIRYPKED